MPWPNGAGITYEVVREPATGDFDWRISLADIDNDCPFSVMPGIDRGIVLMEGSHMVLANSDEDIRVDELVAFNYPGEVAFDCKLGAGPAKDLNIMSRRENFTSHTTVLGPRNHRIDATTETHILVGLRGHTRVENEVLSYRDAAIINGEFEIQSTGTFAHIVFSKVS
jgi:environmental stress-induced protein Ves